MSTVIIFAIAAAVFLPWAFALMDVTLRKPEAWRASGQSQRMWTLVVAFFGILGAIAYLVAARPKFASAAHG